MKIGAEFSRFMRFHESNPLVVVSWLLAFMHGSNWSAEATQEDSHAKLAEFLPHSYVPEQQFNMLACRVRHLATDEMSL